MELGRHSIVEWAESAPDGSADFTPAEEKFVVEAPIGKGGMGEVFLVTDKDLKRQVAMKVLRRDMGGGRDARLHFIAEAQATSQLEHPGIPPVHDIGLTKDGRIYFTMKLVRGRTLREVLHDLILKRPEVQREFTLHRLVTILERIAEALEFAQERGVVHRDIKPENVMLGDYGEVHLMDWGLARIEAESAEHEQIETARTESGLETRHGEIKGTLPYMSPEQLRGDSLDRRSDLYAIGCLLYEILTLHPAFDASDPELVSKISAGDMPDVATRNPRRTVPKPLADICEQAMATDRAERHASADELANALRRWLDGRAEKERRHEEAEKLAMDGKEAARRYECLKTEVDEAETAAEAEAQNYKPFQPVSEKRPMIEARERVETLQTEVALAFAEAQKLLDGALLQEPDNRSARAELVRIWKDRLSDAQRRRDKADIAYAKVMIQRYADEPLVEQGKLLLRSDPPSVVTIARFQEIDGVLTPVDEQSLGTTPLGPVTLPSGSYLCVLKAEGCCDTRYPVLIETEKTWTGEITLRADEDIGAEFVHVPGGPFLYGEVEKIKTKTLPDIAIQKHPVTFEQYIQFLETLDEDEAKERMPQTRGDGPYVEQDDDGNWKVLPILVEGAARQWSLDRYGEGFELRCPVVGISYDDAEAYCKWKSAATGTEWRLPTEEEREKVARGVDGRRFAWGDLEDASLGKCRASREVNSQLEPVGAFPTAASVYGMGDASGGVWDWTSSWEDERRSSRVLRGGSWNLRPSALRCARRFANLPRARGAHLGVRCARGL